MTHLKRFLWCIATLATAGVGAGSSISFVADQGTANAFAIIVVDDEVTPGRITFTIAVTSDPDNGNIGDLLGVFFNMEPYPVSLTAANFAGPNLTHVTVGAGDDVSQDSLFACNNVTYPGLPGFDVGLTFGGCGAAGGLLLSTVFTMDRIYPEAALTAFSFQNFGVRLQAVGAAPGGGEGSAKLFGHDPMCLTGCGEPPQEVPEPSSLLLAAAGAALIALSQAGRWCNKARRA